MDKIDFSFELKKDGTIEYDTTRKDGVRLRFISTEKKTDTLGKERTVLRVVTTLEMNDEVLDEYRPLIDLGKEQFVKLFIKESDQSSLEDID